MEVTDRIASLEQRVQMQEDDIQLLKSALADVVRRLNITEEQQAVLNRKGPTKGGHFWCAEQPTLGLEQGLVPSGHTRFSAVTIDGDRRPKYQRAGLRVARTLPRGGTGFLWLEVSELFSPGLYTCR